MSKSDPLIVGAVNELRDTRYGYMVLNPRDMYVGRCLQEYGEYSEDETAILVQAAKPGFLVLDIGANIGSHTLPLARAVGDNGLVIAFEPQRHAFQMLCANVAINSLMNVITMHSAVGGVEGVTRVPVMNFKDRQNFAGLQLGEWPHGEDTEVVTIDSLQLSACHLMKIDVEGWEGAVLVGAKNTLEKFKPPIYIENNQTGRQGSLIRQLEALGYACYWSLPRLFKEGNYYSRTDDVFNGAISQNMFCVHSSASPEMKNFSRAVANQTGEDVYIVDSGGERRFMPPTAGVCRAELPDGKKIELGGPSGKATVVDDKPTVDDIGMFADKIKARREQR